MLYSYQGERTHTHTPEYEGNQQLIVTSTGSEVDFLPLSHRNFQSLCSSCSSMARSLSKSGRPRTRCMALVTWQSVWPTRLTPRALYIRLCCRLWWETCVHTADKHCPLCPHPDHWIKFSRNSWDRFKDASLGSWGILSLMMSLILVESKQRFFLTSMLPSPLVSTAVLLILECGYVQYSDKYTWWEHVFLLYFLNFSFSTQDLFVLLDLLGAADPLIANHFDNTARWFDRLIAGGLYTTL